VLRNLIIVLGLLTLAVIAVLVWHYYDARRSVSTASIARFMETDIPKLRAFFAPVVRHLRLTKNWGQNGVLNLENAEALTITFIPILARLPQVHSVLIANGDALAYSLMRGDDFWDVRIGRPATAKGVPPALWKRLGPDGTVTAEWTDEKRINPLSLEWYVAATAGLREDIYWTEPHQLFASDDAGVSAAVGWQVNDRGYALAFNILMTDIHRLMADIDRGESMRCFLYADRRVLLDLSRAETSFQESMQAAKSLGLNLPEDPAPNAALASRKKAQSPGESFYFELNGSTWWAHFSDFEDSRVRHGLGIVAPADVWYDRFPIERYLWIPAALVILWIGVWVTACRSFRKRKAPSGCSDRHGIR
jgi:hypothetical protein